MDELRIGMHNGRRQLRKAETTAQRVAFTAARQQRFLEALAYSCNVKAAAAYAGVSYHIPYRHRLRTPAFAEQWREALLIGYDRLEALVLEHAGAGQVLDPGDADAIEASGALPPFDFDRAVQVLAQYRKLRDGAPQVHRGRRPGPPATPEETNAALMKAIEAAQKRLARERERHGQA